MTQAGLPDAPIRMAAHFKSRAILHWLLDRFGGVKGKTVLEPACSGGFHTLETARRGARVIAHDVDRVGLAQARSSPPTAYETNWPSCRLSSRKHL